MTQESLSLFSESKKSSISSKTFNFSKFYSDECFSPEDSNEKVYSTVAKPLILSALEGYNCTIFAYGQTGTGKTYTILGSEDLSRSKSRSKRSLSPKVFTNLSLNTKKGLLLLSLQEIFAIISKSSKFYSVTCSYLEIYNENIYDLISNNEEVLSINEDPAKGFYIKGLCEKPVKSEADVAEIVCKGENYKKYRNCDLNHHSSRSHTIFRVNITSLKDSYCLESVINFVDLAGSERITSDKKMANSESLNEGKHINTSLFYLCSVIYKLSEKNFGQNTHVPYRNSNLTKILRNSIGGNCFTSIVCTGSLVLSGFEMTQSTLNLALVAKSILNKPFVNIKNPSARELVEFYQKDIEKMKALLSCKENLEKNSGKQLKKIDFERKYKKNRCNGWVFNVGDVEDLCGKTKFSSFCWEKHENNEIIQNLTKEKESLSSENNELKSQIHQVHQKNANLLLSLEEYKYLLEKTRKTRKTGEKITILNYIEGLKKKIMILEAKKLENCEVSQLIILEKFFLRCFDACKDLKIQKQNGFRVFDESNFLPNEKFSIWKELKMDFPKAPKFFMDSDKENREN